MSEPTVTPVRSTPKEQSKRELSSPLDLAETKKARALPESPEMDVSTHIRLGDEELGKISSLLIKTFESQISNMISSVTDGVLAGVTSKIHALQLENESLKEKANNLEKRLEVVEESQDRANQYSRRNCLRLSGFAETEHENTDDIVLEASGAIGSDIQLAEIDRSHRVGPPRGSADSDSKPRDIIVKFTSYRSRSKFYKRKSKLRQSNYKSCYINEDLTRSRSDIFRQCRLLMKNKQVNGAWTSDGVILVKDIHNRIHRIESDRQFTDFKVRNVSSR